MDKDLLTEAKKSLAEDLHQEKIRRIKTALKQIEEDQNSIDRMNLNINKQETLLQKISNTKTITELNSINNYD